jgi:hypothetical protein
LSLGGEKSNENEKGPEDAFFHGAKEELEYPGTELLLSFPSLGESRLTQKLRNFAIAIVKLLGVHVGLLEEGEPVVGERGVFFWKDDVATMLDAICTTIGEESG